MRSVQRRRQHVVQRIEAIDLPCRRLRFHNFRAALVQIPGVALPELHVARVLEFLDDWLGIPRCLRARDAAPQPNMKWIVLVLLMPYHLCVDGRKLERQFGNNERIHLTVIFRETQWARQDKVAFV